MRKSSGDAEAGGKQQKSVEDQEGVGRGQGGPEEGGRGGKTWESNGTLQYLPLKAKPLRPKYHAVINKAGRSKSLVSTHTSPSQVG